MGFVSESPTGIPVRDDLKLELWSINKSERDWVLRSHDGDIITDCISTCDELSIGINCYAAGKRVAENKMVTMKTQEQQKAELMDGVYETLNGIRDAEWFGSILEGICKEYEKITMQKPLSADPYADEVFNGRIVNILRDFCGMPIRLSECPHIKTLLVKRNFGYKSQMEYIAVMKEYSFENKLL